MSSLLDPARAQRADETYEGRDLEVLADMPNYYSWIMSWFSAHICGRVVEYGAGTGTFSKHLRPLAQTLTLIEPSVNLHTALRKRFSDDASVVIEALTLEEHVQRTGTSTVDTVVLVNVLEHVEDDTSALTELSRIVRPGGHVLIFVPALTFLMSKLDRLLGHYRRYKSATLRQKLCAAGLDVVTCRYFDFPGILPWFVINRLLGSTSFSPALVKLYRQRRSAFGAARRGADSAAVWQEPDSGEPPPSG